MNRTYVAKPATVKHDWYVVDAANVPVGRLAAQVAQILRGKHKPTFSYHVDTGDFVVVVNADKAVWTGRKSDELIYWHTMWPGGLRNIKRGDMLERKPTRLIEKVVWGMLPKNQLGRHMLRKLKVYAGPEHPHSAQQPQPLKVTQD
ncbi:MAG: 50S ribosomal protein L13 [Fimbriimonadaceae bacterium]|nr:50S ribosomal protein L13 [Fimbriimonadaceae bacterium]